MKYSLRSQMAWALALALLTSFLAAVWTYIEFSRHYNQPRIQVIAT